jgi:hypothetical protein
MKDEMISLETRMLTLLHRAREERDAAARAELNALLRSNAGARRLMARLLADEQAIVNCLREEGIVALLDPAAAAGGPVAPIKLAARPFAWRRALAAAAAGLVVGLFSASLVYGLVMQRGLVNEGIPVPLADGGFESGVEPAAEFVPARTGLWSGDFATLSEGGPEMVPSEGKRMLKFLRTDNRLSPAGVMPSAGELWQVVDLTEARAALGHELAVIEVSARFNQAAVSGGEKTAFGVGLMAFSGSAADAPAVWRERRELALAQADKEELADAEPGTWQRLSAQMTVPREANLLLVQIRAVRKGRGPHSPVLGAHFTDDVRLRALDRPSAETAKWR